MRKPDRFQQDCSWLERKNREWISGLGVSTKRIGQSTRSRAVGGYMFKTYDGVLKMDSKVGNKKVYDRRAYLAFAETAMAGCVKQVPSDLRASGKTMFAP
jgi:hypothetical protein